MKSEFCIVYKRDDAGTSILIPAEFEGTLDELAEKDIPKLEDGSTRPYRIAHVDKIPKDRYFRSAWTDDLDTDTVDVDIVKARDIQMGHVRRLRNKKLENLDADYMISLEREDSSKQASVKQEKQALRDLPVTIDLSKHGEDLDALKVDFGGLEE